MLQSMITLLITATTISARPATSAAVLHEDIPWQIYNLSLHALPTNTTAVNATQYIIFTAIDLNENLTFNTSCNKYVPAGISLFQTSYTPCDFPDAAFSLRSDGRLFFKRRFQNRYVTPFNIP